MFMYSPTAPFGAANLYIHTVHQHEITAQAAKLKGLHARALDVDDLCYDDLARQVLVRDLRKIADDLCIQNYVSTWSYDELSGKLKVVFEFASEADMVLFMRQVG